MLSAKGLITSSEIRTEYPTVRPPVNFDNPPVSEVACSVLFNLPQPLRSTFAGLYWLKIRDRFPQTNEAMPVPPVFESANPALPTANLQLNFLPPVRRLWFSNTEQTRLIQVQEDRFIFNWKRASLDETYPRYETVIAEFEKEFQGFQAFLADEKLGTPTPRQYELVYTNFIGPENGLGEVGQGGLFVDHQRVASDNRYLLEPELINWMSSYGMKDGFGRLHVHAQTAFRPPEMTPIVRLDITARGIPPKPAETSTRAWFDVAHVYITQGFADITVPVLQTKYWKRTP